MQRLPARYNARSPLPAFFAPTNTFQARLVRSFSLYVAHILRPCRRAQIAEAVVCSVAVDMVDLVLWPMTSNVVPR